MFYKIFQRCKGLKVKLTLYLRAGCSLSVMWRDISVFGYKDRVLERSIQAARTRRQRVPPSKYDTPSQCWFNVEPPLVQCILLTVQAPAAGDHNQYNPMGNSLY